MPFLDDDDDVDIEEFRPCDAEPAVGVAPVDDVINIFSTSLTFWQNKLQSLFLGRSLRLFVTNARAYPSGAYLQCHAVGRLLAFVAKRLTQKCQGLTLNLFCHSVSDDEKSSIRLAPGVEFSPELSFGDFDGDKASLFSSSSLLWFGFELGRGLKAGIVLIAFLF